MNVKMKSPATTRKPKSRAMAAVLEAAQDMVDAGLIDKKTMRDYEGLCAVPQMTAEDVVRIRSAAQASQNYFARALNVSASTVQKWESGAKKPSGLAAKMLTIVEKHGLKILS
ncbi:MAG: helix-turn-helix domain-containing protein [Pseudomonadota bacterium]